MSQISFLISSFVLFSIRMMCIVTVIFLFAPSLLVLVLSFTTESILYFPPHQWSTKLYSEIFAAQWLDPLRNSVKIALPAALLAIMLAAPAAYSITRRRNLLAQFCEYASLGPILVPLAAYSVGLYFVMIKLRLTATALGLILAHTVLAIPITLIVLLSMMRRLPQEIELIAMTFGAGRARAIADTTARLLMPAFLAAFIFAFLTSFDDAVLVSFLGGAGVITLSKAIFDSMQFAVDPAIAAISAIMMATTGVLICAAIYLRRAVK